MMENLIVHASPGRLRGTHDGVIHFGAEFDRYLAEQYGFGHSQSNGQGHGILGLGLEPIDGCGRGHPYLPRGEYGIPEEVLDLGEAHVRASRIAGNGPPVLGKHPHHQLVVGIKGGQRAAELPFPVAQTGIRGRWKNGGGAGSPLKSRSLGIGAHDALELNVAQPEEVVHGGAIPWRGRIVDWNHRTAQETPVVIQVELEYRLKIVVELRSVCPKICILIGLFQVQVELVGDHPQFADRIAGFYGYLLEVGVLLFRGYLFAESRGNMDEKNEQDRTGDCDGAKLHGENSFWAKAAGKDSDVSSAERGFGQVGRGECLWGGRLILTRRQHTLTQHPRGARLPRNPPLERKGDSVLGMARREEFFHEKRACEALASP